MIRVTPYASVRILWRPSHVDAKQIDIPCLRHVLSTFRNFCPYRCRSVGVATRYGSDGPGVESWWGRASFSAPILTGPVAHPVFFSRDKTAGVCPPLFQRRG